MLLKEYNYDEWEINITHLKNPSFQGKKVLKREIEF
jgi:hypothetical protein